MFYPGEPIINQSTVSQHLGDVTKGWICGTMPRNFTRNPVGSIVGAPAIHDTFQPIPRSEFGDRIREKEKDQSRMSDFILSENVPCLNQGQTMYCHGNSPCGAVMFLRAAQGLPFVLLSPASIAGPTVNFRNQGGYIADDLNQVATVGCASQEFVPANQIGLSGFKTGWEADAAKYRAREWWDMGHRSANSFDLVMTLVLSGIPVCVAYNWWGHAVTIVDGVNMPGGKFGVRGRNSWGPEYGSNGFFVLDEQYGTPDEAYALRSIVQ